MSWGKEWPTGCISPKTEVVIKQDYLLFTAEAGIIELSGKYQNKVPTHDPYTNPDTHIYYQCDCGAVLDPGTKSFAALNNAAMNSGWKVRWGADSYQPYCVKCGEEVE